jgi:RNA polymerase sigma factor (sigma-70 family)
MADDADWRRFEQMALPHLDAAYNLALWLTRNADDAEDVVQEALLRAMRYMGALRLESARPWLLQVVRHTCYTWLKENRPAEQVLLEAVRDPSTTAQEADVGGVAGLMQDHFGPQGEADLAAAVDHLPLHVENLLRDRWSAVEVIAVSLLRHGRLTDDQFRALFAEALPGVEMAALLDPSSA